MARRYALQALAVLLPCVLVGLIGYKWLRLEQEAEARRSKETANVEAARLRKELTARLTLASQEVFHLWSQRLPGAPPFAPPPPVPEIIASGYLFSRQGKLLYPNYEMAYREAIREQQSAARRPEWQRAMARIVALEAGGKTAEVRRALQGLLAMASSPSLRASVLLYLGRLALAAGDSVAAESYAGQILQCCASTRDEYGVSFALYAAGQLTSAWKAQGALPVRFPDLASRLSELLRRGVIGHPSDLHEILPLAKRVRGEPLASALVSRAEQVAERIRRHTATAGRLEKWLAGSEPPALSTLWSEGRPQLAGVYRAGDIVLVTLFATDSVASWVAQAAGGSQYEAAVGTPGENRGVATLRTPLLPDAPSFELVLRTREADPAVQRRRQSLFAGSLAAAVLLILLVGYFALRDVSRELKLASLRANFVASVTHELKTPLTSIRLLTETLLWKRTTEPGRAEELLRAIVDESERLAQSVDNVLTFSGIEKGAHRYHPTEVALSEVVDDAVRRSQSILGQSGFHLIQERNGEWLRVYADGEGLARALLNLFSNAVKYSGRSREIRLGVHRRGQEAEVRVTDYGVGIRPAEQQRIFESFYRVPEAAKETTGAGLGLALVRHFAEAHGGRVTVESEPGKGSTFSLWLPLVKNDGQHSHR